MKIAAVAPLAALLPLAAIAPSGAQDAHRGVSRHFSDVIDAAPAPGGAQQVPRAAA